jgi:hypothetical protein
VGGTGIGVGAILLAAILGPPLQYENLKTASIISASWGYDSVNVAQLTTRQEILPIKTQDDSGQPAYALLHPETPASQLLAEKHAPSTWPRKKHKLRKPNSHGKSLKTAAKAAKKIKTHSKQQSKSKKQPHHPAKLAANAG